uniref:Uncharacterized protein n=2 Tax=Ixodes scapularis TaxID=6945 RepID=A0A1S4L9E9_IXOSC
NDEEKRECCGRSCIHGSDTENGSTHGLWNRGRLFRHLLRRFQAHRVVSGRQVGTPDGVI